MSVRQQPKQPPQQTVQRVQPIIPQVDKQKLFELTEKIAYELYEKRGRAHGYHEQDWADAEKVALERLLAEKK